MMRDGKRTGKYIAGFPMKTFGITKEQGIVHRKLFANLDGLTNKTIFNNCTAVYC